jgi:hypothetical protein
MLTARHALGVLMLKRGPRRRPLAARDQAADVMALDRAFASIQARTVDRRQRVMRLPQRRSAAGNVRAASILYKVRVLICTASETSLSLIR